MRGVAPRDSCAFSALRLPLFFGGKSFVALVGKPRARMRRENERARIIRPAKRGRGTTGARVASEPWWRGRRSRSFVFVAGQFCSQEEASKRTCLHITKTLAAR